MGEEAVLPVFYERMTVNISVKNHFMEIQERDFLLWSKSHLALHWVCDMSNSEEIEVYERKFKDSNVPVISSLMKTVPFIKTKINTDLWEAFTHSLSQPRRN